MLLSWFHSIQQFKSPIRVLAANFLRSREKQKQINQQLKQQINQQRKENQKRKQQIQKQNQRLKQQQQQIQQQAENQRLRSQPVRLPPDPPLGRSGYGSRRIALAINLARKIGFRPAAQALEIMMAYLEVEQKTPHPTTIRGWLMRWGIASTPTSLEPADDWIWMADHSNQIGQEQVLVVMAVRAAHLPEPGETLKHQDMRVLCVQPGVSWKQQDMEKTYQDLAKTFGRPRSVLTDGAPALRTGAEVLRTAAVEPQRTAAEVSQEDATTPLILGDFKHAAANVFKKLVGDSERFQEFLRQVSSSRHKLQQTELAHLSPPKQKSKARFMNMASTLRWACFIQWLLATPSAAAREDLCQDRLEAKLGWLKDFSEALPMWEECQRLLSCSLTFINEQGVYRGACRDLRGRLGEVSSSATSRCLAARLLRLVREAEQPLRAGERLSLSTEILESSFSLYKGLEGQQSRGGFTSLLACFPGLLVEADASSVSSRFSRVSASDVKTWVKKHIGETVTSRRRKAHAEYKRTAGRNKTSHKDL